MIGHPVAWVEVWIALSVYCYSVDNLLYTQWPLGKGQKLEDSYSIRLVFLWDSIQDSAVGFVQCRGKGFESLLELAIVKTIFENINLTCSPAKPAVC
jgi:hypothetical protein